MRLEPDVVDFFWVRRLINPLPVDAVDVLRVGRWCLLDERVSGIVRLEVISGPKALKSETI